MANTVTTTAPLGAVTILHVVGTINHLFQGVVDMYMSRKTRLELSELSDAQLDDIGLSRGDIAKF